MTLHPTYDVRHSEPPLRSLQQLSPSAQSKITDLLLEFGTNLRMFLSAFGAIAPSTRASTGIRSATGITYRLNEEVGIVTCHHLAASHSRVTAF